MKIAVYTIALNEEQFVQRWYETAKDADYLLIADTGSTDKTVRLAKKLGINVVKISIKPWRFDDARNAALALLPDDIDMCISLDMDETLSNGWREALEKTTGTQILYKYTQNWKDADQTIPETIMAAMKVHARHGYRWKYIVHEYISPDRNPNHVEEKSEDFEIYHHPDLSKDRAVYNPLIKDALDEDPTSDRYQLYYARTLVHFGEDKKEAARELKKFIKMPKKVTSPSDVTAAYIMLSAIEKRNAEKYLLKAIDYYDQIREPIVTLAVHYFLKEEWEKCEEYCEKALKITQKVTDHNYADFAWRYLPTNMLYVSRHNKKLDKSSVTYNDDTLKMNPLSLISSNFELFTEEDVL
jgi:glycosyltransferase involved in cell wall biosynthesis